MAVDIVTEVELNRSFGLPEGGLQEDSETKFDGYGIEKRNLALGLELMLWGMRLTSM